MSKTPVVVVVFVDIDKGVHVHRCQKKKPRKLHRKRERSPLPSVEPSNSCNVHSSWKPGSAVDHPILLFSQFLLDPACFPDWNPHVPSWKPPSLAQEIHLLKGHEYLHPEFGLAETLYKAGQGVFLSKSDPFETLTNKTLPSESKVPRTLSDGTSTPKQAMIPENISPHKKPPSRLLTSKLESVIPQLK